MPLVTLTVRKPKTQAFKTAALDAVHAALVASGVPEADFRFNPAYPDLAAPRGDDFVLIQILLSAGRSVKVKKKIVADIVGGIQRKLELSPEQVMICFKETLWENWSFGGGRFLHA